MSRLMRYGSKGYPTRPLLAPVALMSAEAEESAESTVSLEEQKALSGGEESDESEQASGFQCSWGEVQFPAGRVNSAAEWIVYIAPWYVRHSTVGIALQELSTTYPREAHRYTQKGDATLRAELEQAWENTSHAVHRTSATVYGFEELKKRKRTETQKFTRRVKAKMIHELKEKDKRNVIDTAPYFKSAAAQTKAQQIKSRPSQARTFTVDAQGDTHQHSPAQSVRSFEKVGGAVVPVVRSAGLIHRKHRRDWHALFADAEAPPYYALAYTDNTKTGIDIATPSTPKELRFGLLIPPRHALSSALRRMHGKGQVVRTMSDLAAGYHFMACGDGTDLARRNVVVSGGRLVDRTGRALTKPSQFFPLLLFFGKESEHRLAAPLLTLLKTEMLSWTIELVPDQIKLAWDRTGSNAGDNKFLWHNQGVKGTGESVCYLCEVPRKDFGAELGHPGFRDNNLSALVYRYLTSLFELKLLVEQRKLRGHKPWTLSQLKAARVRLTNEHGSIQFPVDFIGNTIAQGEAVAWLGTSLLNIPGLPAEWNADTQRTVKDLYTALLVAAAQLHDAPLPSINTSLGYSLTTWFATIPVNHDLKMVLRYYIIDLLLLAMKGGASRDSLERRIIASAGSQSLYAYFYSKSSFAVFLNDRQKWTVLPPLGQLLVRFLELLADQAISRDMCEFNLATFSAAVFFHQPTARVFRAEVTLYPQTKAAKDNNREFLDQGSAWDHSFKHVMAQVERTRLPLSDLSEGIVDQSLGTFKQMAEGRESHTFDDLHRVYDLLTHDTDVRMDKGLDHVKQQDIYNDRPLRLPIVFAPCFVTHAHVRNVMLHYLIRCAQQTYANLIKQHATIRHAHAIVRDASFEFSRALSDYAAQSEEWLFVSLCGTGLCSSCAPPALSSDEEADVDMTV